MSDGLKTSSSQGNDRIIFLIYNDLKHKIKL